MATLFARSVPGARLHRLSATTTPSPPRPLSRRKLRRCIASYSHSKARVERISLAHQLPPAYLAPGWLPSDAHVRAPLPPTYFRASTSAWTPLDGAGQEPADPNKAKLGKTLRILQERMPTLLQSPLPQEILAPNISLRLFPSTYRHLPIVSGRVAYNAALWTSPIAWNRVPLIGNVRLEILAERVTTEPLTFLPRRAGAIPEQLVVRWCEKRKSPESADDATAAAIARSLRIGRGGVDPSSAFSGLFIFDFDAEGRVLTHTIETAQQGGNWESGYGAKFVGLTDWLLGGIRNPGDTPPVSVFERQRRE